MFCEIAAFYLKMKEEKSKLKTLMFTKKTFMPIGKRSLIAGRKYETTAVPREHLEKHKQISEIFGGISS